MLKKNIDTIASTDVKNIDTVLALAKPRGCRPAGEHVLALAKGVAQIRAAATADVKAAVGAGGAKL